MGFFARVVFLEYLKLIAVLVGIMLIVSLSTKVSAAIGDTVVAEDFEAEEATGSRGRRAFDGGLKVATGEGGKRVSNTRQSRVKERVLQTEQKLDLVFVKSRQARYQRKNF